MIFSVNLTPMSSAILRLVNHSIAYFDVNANNNPRKRAFDLDSDIPNLLVDNPDSTSRTLALNETYTFFNGSRTLTVDGTTTFSVGLVANTPDRYRFHVTAGTAAGFRTNRNLNLSGSTINVVVNANGTAVLNVTSGSFAGILVGDVVWLPGTDEIMSTPFHPGNLGFWYAAAVTSTSLTLQRTGDFEAFGETGIAITAANQIIAYSATGVQEGDALQIISGFVPSTQRTYSIVSVTPTYLEVESTLAIPSETGILPTSAGLAVFTDVKRYIRIEADQECVVRINGDTGDFQRISPWQASDPCQVGAYEKHGPVFSLAIVNKASRPCNVNLISAE